MILLLLINLLNLINSSPIDYELDAERNACSCNNNDLVISKKLIIGNTGSKICAGCIYTNIDPAGYDTLTVQYKYGQTIQQAFFQNGKMIGECPRATSCNKEIKLDPRYPVKYTISRNTEKNKYFTHSRGEHFISYKTNKNSKLTVYGNNSCMLPPELNVEKSEQSGLIEGNCTYDYYKMLGHNFIIEIETSSNITIEIYKTNVNLNNEKLIYNNTGTYIFANIQLNSSNDILDEYNFTHIKIYNSDPTLLENLIDIFDIYPLNNETDFNSNPTNDLYLIDDNKSNNYSLIITSLVTSLISLTLIFIYIIIIIIKCTKCKCKKFSNYDGIDYNDIN